MSKKVIIAISVVLLSGITLGIFLTSKKNQVQKDSSTQEVGKVEPTQPVETNPEIDPNKKIIVAFGDSLTAGFGLTNPASSYPEVLEKKLQENQYPYQVLNYGVSGNTTFDGLRRVDTIINLKPDIVILELGANDVLRGLSAETAFQNLSGIIEKLQAAKIEILLAKIEVPENLNNSSSEVYLSIYDNLIQEYNLNFIPSFLNSVSGIADLNLQDGLHPNEFGYEIVVNQNVWPALEPLLKKDL